MELITIFFSTFFLVFIGELGDKTQIAAGTGTLANQNYIRVIFISSSLALITVAGLTVFFAGFIPDKLIPVTAKVGGILLIVYGIYLYLQAGKNDDAGEEVSSIKNSSSLFLSHFLVVFIAELGDKTQFATLAVAIENQSQLPIVFIASATALVTVTFITVWGVTKIPTNWVKKVQQSGAVLMAAYGCYMLLPKP